MIGPKGLERVVNALRVIAPELPFEIQFREISGNEQVFEEHGYRITAFRVNHNVLCYGYTVEILRQGKFSSENARAAQIPLKFWNPLQKGQTIEDNGIVYTPDMVLGPPRKGLKLTYTTDTRPTESILRNAAGSDLFICEGMYGEPDKDAKARENKHMTFKEAATLARDAGVKEMWLTHYSPSLVRPDEFMDDVRAIFPQSYPGKDGKSVELNFEED
jgi:ribonuclease Z